MVTTLIVVVWMMVLREHYFEGRRRKKHYLAIKGTRLKNLLQKYLLFSQNEIEMAGKSNVCAYVCVYVCSFLVQAILFSSFFSQFPIFSVSSSWRTKSTYISGKYVGDYVQDSIWTIGKAQGLNWFEIVFLSTYKVDIMRKNNILQLYWKGQQIHWAAHTHTKTHTHTQAHTRIHKTELNDVGHHWKRNVHNGHR